MDNGGKFGVRKIQRRRIKVPKICPRSGGWTGKARSCKVPVAWDPTASIHISFIGLEDEKRKFFFFGGGGEGGSPFSKERRERREKGTKMGGRGGEGGGQEQLRSWTSYQKRSELLSEIWWIKYWETENQGKDDTWEWGT
jgi:hypothetical protein